MDQSVVHLHVIDFVIFGAMLFVSGAIGVFFAYKDRTKQTTQNYYFGNQEVSMIAVGISLAVSFISAITVIGIPVEIYLYGTIYVWILISKLWSSLFAFLYYIPLLHRLKLDSIYEYLQLRFNRGVRTLVSGITVIQMILYMSVTTYVPSLALSAVTPLELNWSIALTSVICTFYTSIGGIKAVIWTDVLQGLIMFLGSVSVLVATLISVGGIEPVKSALDRGERMNFLTMNPDITIRSTLWTIMIGLAVNNCTRVCISQIYAQRYLTCKSTKGARIAFGIQLIPVIAFTLIAIGIGFAMFAYYEGCDPVMAKQIQKSDQTTPWLAVDILQFAPGTAGLFISAAFSGTLSSLSSSINSVAALAIMDFILPTWPNMTTRRRMRLSKWLSFLLGSISMGMAYAISLIELNIIPITASVIGFAGGPMLGVFTAGIFMPWVNSKGAVCGLITGWGIAGWVGFSAILIDGVGAKRVKLPLSADSCNVTTEYPGPQNISVSQRTTASWMEFSGDYGSGEDYISATALDVERPLFYDTLYSISPFLYGTLGLVVCLVVANIVSILTGPNKPHKANPDLFMPIADSQYLPRRLRKFLRFGVPKRSDRGVERTTENAVVHCTSPKDNKSNKGMISSEDFDDVVDSSSLPSPPDSPNVWVRKESYQVDHKRIE